MKSPMSSRVIWVNSLTTLIAVITVVSGQPWVANYPQAATIAVGCLSVLNIALRFLTTEPISVPTVR
jgi:hypothetical protein